MIGFTESEMKETISLLADFMQGHKVFDDKQLHVFVAYSVGGAGEYNFFGKVSALSFKEAEAKFADIIRNGAATEEVQVSHWSRVFWQASSEDVANMAESPFLA